MVDGNESQDAVARLLQENITDEISSRQSESSRHLVTAGELVMKRAGTPNISTLSYREILSD